MLLYVPLLLYLIFTLLYCDTILRCQSMFTLNTANELIARGGMRVYVMLFY